MQDGLVHTLDASFKLKVSEVEEEAHYGRRRLRLL